MIISNGSILGFAPQALAETTPTLSNGYFYAQSGLTLAGRYATYAALYRAQPSVSTLVDKIANAAARLTVKVWDTTPATGKVWDTTSDYAKLIAAPCNLMSPYDFWRWTVSTYEIYGETFWYKQRNAAGVVTNLLPMHPSRTAVHRSHDGGVEFIFTLGVASAGILHAPASEVVAFRRFNPDSMMRGLSRLEPLRSTMLNEDAARRAMQSFWNKGARPGLFIRHAGELSQPAQDRIKAQVDSRHGGPDNVGGTMILEEGMEAQVVQLTAEEMQYIESRKMNLQEACMVYDVPPPVVHILDHATFSNITEQMRSMYRDTMAPRLEDWESTIDFALRGEFFKQGERRATFSLDEVLRGDFETRATAVIGLVANGVMKPSEARPLFDLDDAGEVADKLYANAALTVLGSTPNQPALAPSASLPVNVSAPDDIGSAGASELSKAVTRSLNGRISRVKSTSKSLKAGLVAGHQSELDKFFEKQHASVVAALGSKAPGVFDPTAWDGDLTTILHSLSEATAKAIGAKVASDLGGRYDGADIADYLTTSSKSSAVNINQTTFQQIVEKLKAAELDAEATASEYMDELFLGEIAARSNQISLTRVAVIGGLAALVAARLSKAKTKTWVVTDGKPRPSHSAMNGETVNLNELFSNGMTGPGDYSGGADEVAGCTCDLVFSVTG